MRDDAELPRLVYDPPLITLLVSENSSLSASSKTITLQEETKGVHMKTNRGYTTATYAIIISE